MNGEHDIESQEFDTNEVYRKYFNRLKPYLKQWPGGSWLAAGTARGGPVSAYKAAAGPAGPDALPRLLTFRAIPVGVCTPSQSALFLFDIDVKTNCYVALVIP